MSLSDKSVTSYWRELAQAEQARVDRLMCEIGDLKTKVAMYEAEETARIRKHVAKVKSCR